MAILTSGPNWLNISFTNEHVKTFSSSPIIEEMQIKIAMGHTGHIGREMCAQIHTQERVCCPHARSAVSKEPCFVASLSCSGQSEI